MARDPIVTASPIVTVRRARFAYPGGAVAAVDGVSLDVSAGEIVGIAGQNGSGKTTLARLLNGLLRPTAGSVVVDCLDTCEHTVQRLAAHVGLVFQNPNHQLFAATVSDEIAFGPRNLGIPEEEIPGRVAEVARLLDLEAVLDRHPYRLGFAVRKLVAIASVLAMGPPVLVLDEPTTGQDQRTTATIERLLLALRDRGFAVVCIAHDLRLHAAIAGRLVVMAEGRIIADGPPRRILVDDAVMARARLVAPQVTRLSRRLPGRERSEPALTVAELAADLRAGGGR